MFKFWKFTKLSLSFLSPTQPVWWGDQPREATVVWICRSLVASREHQRYNSAVCDITDILNSLRFLSICVESTWRAHVFRRKLKNVCFFHIQNSGLDFYGEQADNRAALTFIEFKSPDVWWDPMVSYCGVANILEREKEMEGERDINVCILTDKLNEHA
jgi:hypothetical protein